MINGCQKEVKSYDQLKTIKPPIGARGALQLVIVRPSIIVSNGRNVPILKDVVKDVLNVFYNSRLR